MKRYFIHVPGWIYAMTAYGYNERDARSRFRTVTGWLTAIKRSMTVSWS